MEKIATISCPFPIIQFEVNVKYAEVRKPSGVGYIILTLIKEAKRRDETLIYVLKNFGVPEDLLSIFGDEINQLLRYEILSIKDESITFEDYRIEDFYFTEKGEEMFRKLAIPTGEEKYKQVKMYYNPVASVFSFKDPGKVMKPNYDASFTEELEIPEDDMKDYIEKNKNTKDIRLQKEEQILDCNEMHSDKIFIVQPDNNLELHIDKAGINVKSKIPEIASFYKTYFTSNMLEQQLTGDSKFQFNNSEISIKQSDSLAEFKNISKIYLPEEYSKQIKQPAKLILTHDKYKHLLPSDCAFALVKEKEMLFYTAVNVELTEHLLGQPVHINLLIEQLCDEEQKMKILKMLADECIAAKEFSVEHCKLIKIICELTGNFNFGKLYIIDTRLDVESEKEKKSHILLEANKIFTDNQEWKKLASQYADGIYNELVAEITADNILYTIKVAKNLAGIRKPAEHTLIEDITKKIKTNYNTIALFALLTNAGFSEKEVLPFANAAKDYAAKVLAGEGNFEQSIISDNFSTLAHNLNALKIELDIKNPVNYSFREGYNKETFKREFKAFKSKLSTLKKYAIFAKEEFNELDKYESIMQPLFDDITIEENASRSPENIDKKYISNKISKGDLKDAVLCIFIRLEYVIGKLTPKELSDAYSKIEYIAKENIITKETATILHELREFRNKKIAHYSSESESLKYDKEKITKWANTVFSIAEKPEDKK